MKMMAPSENNRYIVQVYVGALSALYEALSVEASKQTTSEEIVSCIVERLGLNENVQYELAEVIGDDFGQECKERSLSAQESPVQLMMLWPKKDKKDHTSYRFYLRERAADCSHLWREFVMDPQLIKDYFHRFLYQPKDREYPDLCQLPDLNEQTLLDNLRARFVAGHIYTYVGSILIALNPFKFYPIYNPKYVKLYQNRRLGPNLPPHIFAVADKAYHCMLKDRKNQCIVISGESGSGKTESTNFLLHHLTALSQKGSHGSGVEQTILSAGPVLEAFGNAKTAHNNNSSRFGKFIQVNYKENGMVHGAVVQKYLLEKSRICSQGREERNYHVFYYLLEGANEQEKQILHLKSPDQYYYLNKTCPALDNVDESYEFSRLKQSMEMVGFTPEKQRRLFSVLSAVLLLGNVEFQPRKSAYHHDEAVGVKNPETVALISELLRVKQETLMQALTSKRAKASGETLIINYKLPEAIASRDAMAKCLYGALFDWIVLQVNHALLSKKDTLREHQGNSIGVLDIFGFEDFGLNNSFEQLCINYANEHLQYYFNQHVFKYEQEEYRKEGIRWKDIDFMDNTGCLQLIEGKPNGLLCLLDDQCNFPGATNETLLQKFNSVHKDNKFYKKPQKKEAAFIVEHYAGKVKYQVTDMREKNLDLMRQDIVGVLKNSSMAFVRELVGADPVAVFRWAIVRAFFRSYFAFHEAGRKHRQGRVDGNKNNIQQRYHRNHTPNENLISKQRNTITFNLIGRNNNGNNELNDVPNNNRLSWPQFYQRNRTSSNNNSNSNEGGNASGASTTSTTSTSVEGRYYTTNKWREKLEANNSNNSSSSSALERVLCPDEARAIQRANQIVMKNKSFRPRERSKKGLKNLQSVKTLAGRTGLASATNQNQLGKARKQPMTVTAQFQQSLHSLMDTLNQANPFFIRCIKSNSNKVPNEFDDETVQRQLRYTGMLETVRIRQAGFNVRLTYDEFIQLYRILLPKGLLSSQNDVRDFLATLNLNRDNYQLGSSKVFLRESEKYKLDCKLHQQIMASIITLQRWFRTCLERRRFLRIRSAAVTLQSFARMVIVQQQYKRILAVIKIQKAWRGYKCRLWYEKFKRGLVKFQAHCKGVVIRKMVAEQKSAPGFRRKQISAVPIHLQVKHGSSSDEAFISKESSQEEFYFDNVDRAAILDRKMRDSDEFSSGIQDDETTSAQFGSKISLRSTVSLPIVSSSGTTGGCVNREPIQYPFLTSIRLEESDKLRKISKSNKTIDNSDLDYITGQYRKGSGDSLNSQRSFESSDSQTSNTIREQLKHVPSTFTKQQSNWSSTSTSDSFSDYGQIDSTLNKMLENVEKLEKSPSYDSFSSTDELKSDNNSRAPVVSASNMKVIKPVPKRANFAPIRRPIRTDDRSPVYPYDKVDKTTDFFGKPEAPTRMRGSKRGHVKSLGEDMADSFSSTFDKNLGTIDESKVANSKNLRINELKQNLTPKKYNRHLGSESLKRRNSDPATAKLLLVSDHPGGATASPHIESSPKWADFSSLTAVSIAGHSFRKCKILKDNQLCAFCKEIVDNFYTQGYKCTKCKLLFHTKCIQNKVFEIPCDPNYPNEILKRRKHRKHSRPTFDAKPTESESSKFNLTGTSEFTDRTDQILKDGDDLSSMQGFIMSKILKMDSEFSETGRSSKVDTLFKQALREFKENLVQLYSASMKNQSEFSMRYKDLIVVFMQAMETVCQREQKNNVTADFPVTMGVNAFRGFMNEFMQTQKLDEKPKAKRKKEKKSRKEPPVKAKGHIFLLTIINIPTACEICNSFFMWPIERGLVCQYCKLTCHKKCYSKATNCLKVPVEKFKVFGAPLMSLVGEDRKIPLVIERLLHTIEVYGLNTEGIYRKSGVSSKIKELKAKMDENPDSIEFEKYQVHVLASVLKSFLREMPEPLLTFECYENFITAANLANETDRVTTLYDILKKLPTPNYDLMERLMFHLARVALHEDVNRMNAASLAIVFAPCVLRTNKQVPAQESLHDIGSQTQCIETIIRAQIRKVRSTLDDIDTLDTARQAATNRLSSLRSSKIFSPDELNPQTANMTQSSAVDVEENLLVDHIQEIQKETELLTSILPTLTHAASDDDMLSTDGDGSLDDLSCIVSSNEQKRAKVLRSISSGGSDCSATGAVTKISVAVPPPKLLSNEMKNSSECSSNLDEDPIMV